MSENHLLSVQRETQTLTPIQITTTRGLVWKGRQVLDLEGEAQSAAKHPQFGE